MIPYTPEERIEILRAELRWREGHVHEARQRLINALLATERPDNDLINLTFVIAYRPSEGDYMGTVKGEPGVEGGQGDTKLEAFIRTLDALSTLVGIKGVCGALKKMLEGKDK